MHNYSMGKIETVDDKWEIAKNVQFCNWSINRHVFPLKSMHSLTFTDIRDWEFYGEIWVKIMSLPLKKTWQLLVPTQKRTYVDLAIRNQVYYVMRRESDYRDRNRQLPDDLLSEKPLWRSK